MHVPEVSIPSARPERVTTLPQSGREVEAWMWNVLNGGTVPSDRRAADVQKLHTNAVALRAVGAANGQVDSALPPAVLTQAAEYARLLGWQVTESV